jgi:GH3 auxin-responsive promoter
MIARGAAAFLDWYLPRRHFVNAFGENVIVEEVERALLAACRRTHAEAVEFTVAPRYPSTREARGGHDWLVEFAEPPRCSLDVFRRTLDETLMALNTDYRTKRTSGGWAWWSLASSNCRPGPSIDGCARAVGSAISTRCRGSPTTGPSPTACSRWPRVRPHRRSPVPRLSPRAERLSCRPPVFRVE